MRTPIMKLLVVLAVLAAAGARCSENGDSVPSKDTTTGDTRQAGDAVLEIDSGPSTDLTDAIEDGSSVPDLQPDLQPETTPPEITIPDITDVQPEATVELVEAEVEEDTGKITPTFDPSFWGPYQVGTRSYSWYDTVRARNVPVTVWYPALPQGEEKATYLLVIKGDAYQQPAADKSGAPYPLVLFSHGFNGKAEQSITFTEYVASHGYVVAAMDHVGNTLTDFSASDELVAEVALERPYDVAFTYKEMIKYAEEGSEVMAGMVDPTRVGMTGHSFGAYTALVVGGGAVNVDEAQAACEAGSESNIFCPYIGYWPAGTIHKLVPPIAELDAVVSMAPGGYAAFGSEGLTQMYAPVMLIGGTLDDMMPIEIETKPIYQSLPPPKIQAIIENAGHMSFTNICDLPQSQLYFGDFCDLPGMIDKQQVFNVANTMTVAFLNLYVKEQASGAYYLTPEYLDAKYGYVQLEADPAN